MWNVDHVTVRGTSVTKHYTMWNVDHVTVRGTSVTKHYTMWNVDHVTVRGTSVTKHYTMWNDSCKTSKISLDFKLSPCFICNAFSFGYLPGV